MPNPLLNDSIRLYSAQGYSSAQIRQALLGQGWSQKDVDEALENGLPGPLSSISPISLPSWSGPAAIGAIVLVLVIAGIYIWLPRQASQLLDVSIHPMATEVSQGQPLDFIVELVNVGSSKRFDVNVKSELVSVAANDIVASKIETAAIETRNALRQQLMIPKDAPPGRYVVRTMVEYDSQVARASFSLKVSEGSPISPSASTSASGKGDNQGPETPSGTSSGTNKWVSSECPDGCNDYDPCTTDRCVSGSCMHKKVSPCCGNQVCESSESRFSCPDDCQPLGPSREESVDAIKSRAVDLSLSEMDGAMRLCRSLSLVADHDNCISQVSKRVGNPDICSQINGDKERDGCYLDIALGRDRFDVCDKVLDRWLKSSCYSYANLKATGR